MDKNIQKTYDSTSRTERIFIKKSDKNWKHIDHYSFLCKNLYNSCNYIIRQEYFKTMKEKEEGLRENEHIYSRFDLKPLLKENIDYRRVKTCIGYGVSDYASQNWKSYKNAVQDFYKNPQNYKGKPKIPRYLPKNGRCLIAFPRGVFVKDGYVYFAVKEFKCLNNCYKTTLSDETKINQCRIIPKGEDYILELVYTVELPEMENETPKRIASIDMGVNNLITLTTNCGVTPLVINGRPLKSINRYYNKEIAKYKSLLDTKNKDEIVSNEIILETKNAEKNETAKDTEKKKKIPREKPWSHRLSRITSKRNNKVDTYIHQSTSKVIQFCLENNIESLVIGRNKDWKQNYNKGKLNNQNFTQIPHLKVIQQLAYKCRNHGILFDDLNEAYTSRTSFLDNEEPTKEVFELYKDKNRRIHRGLFISNKGIPINADVNAAYQIMKIKYPKDIPTKEIGLHPVIINAFAEIQRKKDA